MALSLTNYPDSRDPAHPLATAYAWLAFLALDLRAGTGRIVFNVHPNEAAWEADPVAQVPVGLGQGVGEAHFPSLAELMADPEFATAYNTIGAKLYGSAVAALPAFAGASPA